MRCKTCGAPIQKEFDYAWNNINYYIYYCVNTECPEYTELVDGD